MWLAGHVARAERCVLHTKILLELLTEGSLLEFLCLNWSKIFMEFPSLN